MTKIKMCGLSRIEDIEAVNIIKPDCIGFVFAKKSKRYVSPDTAEKLKSLLDPEIKAVGVFVNEDAGIILNLIDNNIIDIVQLHGSEDEAYIQNLKSRINISIPVWQAFRIRSSDDLDKARVSSADEILLDAGVPGSGTCFDWNLLKNFDREYILAGGLNPENITEAITTLHPCGVDVSSGIEQDGKKSPELMQEFADRARTNQPIRK